MPLAFGDSLRARSGVRDGALLGESLSVEGVPNLSALDEEGVRGARGSHGAALQRRTIPYTVACLAIVTIQGRDHYLPRSQS